MQKLITIMFGWILILILAEMFEILQPVFSFVIFLIKHIWIIVVEYLNNKGVALKSIKENIDTSTNFGKLMITFLGAIYEFERANLLERQRDGIAVAKKQGKYKGRKKVPKPANFKEVYQKWLNRQITSISAIRELNISEYTFYKFVREENANG
ncbi:MAG: recombinase family protein [Candidatus Gastranaerophilaceae bacterium]